MRASRCENVASVKRRTDLGQAVSWICQLDRSMGGLLVEYIAEQAIVGTDEEPVASVKRDCAPAAAHAGIDHTDENGVSREIAIGIGENPGRRSDILRSDIVRNIDNVDIWRNARDYPFHYTDISISGAKIGEKSHHRACSC